MDSILNELRKTISAGFYYVAVTIALTLPDICAALQSPNGESNSKKYKNWYNKYLLKHYPFLTADDCYGLRCGVVHQGRLSHPDFQYSRVLFTFPDSSIRSHRCIMNDALNLDAGYFCEDVMNSVIEWFNENKSNSQVQKNLKHLVQLHPQGLAPYIVGMPVIA